VAVGADHGYAIKDSAVGLGLAGKAVKRVARTLDLIGVEPPVNHGDISATVTSQDAELVNDPAVWVGSMQSEESRVQGGSNVSISRCVFHELSDG
jgi:hypothetical protein